MVEACAFKEGLHFHDHPRTAHRNRRSWLKAHHPDLLDAWDQLWGIYGALGYGGLDGDRAEQALAILKNPWLNLAGGKKLQSEVFEKIERVVDKIKEAQ